MPMTHASTHGLVPSEASAGSVLAGLGATLLLAYTFMAAGMAIVVPIIAPQEVTVAWFAKIVLLSAGSVVGGIFCVKAYGRNARRAGEATLAARRKAEHLAEVGTLVQAKILRRRAKRLQNPCFRGGSENGAHVAMGLGAYLILTGRWSMTIEYEVDGQRIVDHGKVPSQVYYRYAKADTMPIRVLPDAPTQWIPVLERRRTPSAQLAAVPVTVRP